MRARTHSGVTLIELLVAMGIMALLVIIINAVFTAALRGWRKSDSSLEVTTAAHVILERMTREIANAVIEPGRATFYCVGFDHASPSGWRTNSQADEFYCISPAKIDNDQGSDLCEVGYWLGLDTDGEPELKRFYVPDKRRSGASDFDFNFATGTNYSFALQVTDLQFTYFDDAGNISDSWNSRTASTALRRIQIEITIVSGKGNTATNPDRVEKTYRASVVFP